MLSYIDIRDFAIVDHISLELDAGMTVLTGETGAGKSILIDALGLVLGERASGSPVRSGARQTEVVASFDVERQPTVLSWLQERDLAQDEPECLVRRSVTAEGRSRAFVNGRPVPVQDLRELGEMLVDIHGQHAHQSLLRKDTQRDLLDEFAGHGELRKNLRGLYREWRDLEDELGGLGGSRAERAAEMELLGYQLQELEQLDPGANDYNQISAEHKRLGAADQLRAGLGLVLDALYEDETSTLPGLETTSRQLADLVRLDENLAPMQEQLDSLAIQLREVVADLRSYGESVELDPERFSQLEQQIADFMQLARKHRVEPSGLAELQLQLQQRLDDLLQGDARVQELLERQQSVLASYEKNADKLHKQRLKAAKTLSRAVSANMQVLGMPKGHFLVEVAEISSDRPNADGRDQINFLVTTNPGQPPKPLNKVASGGELSRISLAIQVINAGDHGVPTLIFDEVDVGVGGGVAEIVGQQLKNLGQHRQVLCITHLPQVASQGQQHLQVHKDTARNRTNTRVASLDAQQRVEEIARMLGGLEITEQTLAHAREMLERAG